MMSKNSSSEEIPLNREPNDLNEEATKRRGRREFRAER